MSWNNTTIGCKRSKIRLGAIVVIVLLSIICVGWAQPPSEKSETEKEGIMKATVKCEGDRVWIEGVDRLKYPDTFNSIISCLGTALRAIGEDMTYDYLMGASGASFRVQVTPTGPCPCAPHANLGFRCTEQAVADTNYDLQWYKVMKEDPESVKKAQRMCIESIDKGIPVLWSSEECGVLIGYVNSGEKWLVRTYWDKDNNPTETKDWPWELGILSKREKVSNRRAVLLGSFETAVEMSQAGKVRLDKGFLVCGFPAYQTWIKALLDDECWQKVNNGKPKGDTGNAWCYDNLIDARGTAARYLWSIERDFKAETAAHLTKAGNLYEQIANKLRGKRKNAPYEWELKEGEHWTREMRHAEAAVLKEALALEKKAIAEIEKALVAEGIKAPVVLKKVRQSFDQVEKETKSFSQSRTDLLMRLVFMRAAGLKNIDYDTLIAVSGFGASFAYHPKKFQVMYQPPDPPAETEALIARATDFGWECLPKVKSTDEAWELVKKTIDSGKPVEGKWYDDWVFLGYQDAVQKEDRRVYTVGGWDPPGWWTWEKFEDYAKNWGTFGKHTKKLSKASTKEIALEVMKGIVEYAEHDERTTVDWMKDAEFGWAGIEAYAADIADTTKKPDYFYPGWLGCHSIYRQITGRKCIVTYLKRVAKEFPKNVSSHILTAAEEYESAWSAWQEWEKHLGQAEGRSGEGTLKAWTVEESRQAGAAAVRKALEHEKAAFAKIEKALAAEGIKVPIVPTSQFTNEQKKRLLQWQNLFGLSLKKCLQGAEREPVIYELLALELLLEPLSEDAKMIRCAMTKLEPADLTYWPKIEAVVKAIATIPLPAEHISKGELILPALGWNERLRQVSLRSRAMVHWLNGMSLDETKRSEDTDVATVEEVYRLLGTPNADKKRLIALVIEKLEGSVDPENIEALGKSKRSKDFGHRLEMLDPRLWSFDHNFKLLLGDIGRGRVSGEWHKPGGPFAWGNGNPAEASKAAAAVKALEAWLAGKPSNHELAVTLGNPNDYKEKVWLVRCLHTYLRNHLSNYYPSRPR